MEDKLLQSGQEEEADEKLEKSLKSSKRSKVLVDEIQDDAINMLNMHSYENVDLDEPTTNFIKKNSA